MGDGGREMREGGGRGGMGEVIGGGIREGGGMGREEKADGEG